MSVSADVTCILRVSRKYKIFSQICEFWFSCLRCYFTTRLWLPSPEAWFISLTVVIYYYGEGTNDRRVRFMRSTLWLWAMISYNKMDLTFHCKLSSYDNFYCIRLKLFAYKHSAWIGSIPLSAISLILVEHQPKVGWACICLPDKMCLNFGAQKSVKRAFCLQCKMLCERWRLYCREFYCAMLNIALSGVVVEELMKSDQVLCQFICCTSTTVFPCKESVAPRSILLQTQKSFLCVNGESVIMRSCHPLNDSTVQALLRLRTPEDVGKFPK